MIIFPETNLPPRSAEWTDKVELEIKKLEKRSGGGGASGSDGQAGPQGPQGEAGPAGADGAQGPAGPEGPQGPQGEIGPQGPQGIQGEIGPQGIQGIQGPAGADGLDGADGATGPMGPQGPQGIQGEQGPQGIQGLTGATGPEGPQGIQGETGLQGPQGEIGPMGPAGPTGATGATGPEGPMGLTGLSAYQVAQLNGFMGTEAEWLASLVGADGADGATGPQGDIGLTGPAGPTGPQGPQGIQGDIGLTGPAGATGPQGPQGIQGETGLTGPAGPAGADGVDGVGVPAGGTAGQLLSKVDATDYNTAWVPAPDMSLFATSPVTYDSGTHTIALNQDAFDHISSLNYAQFDLTPTGVPVGPGILSWNPVDKTLDLQSEGVTYQLGQELVQNVQRFDNSGLTNGKVIYNVGSNGANILVDYALATGDPTSTNTFGVMTDSASGGAKAPATTFGLVRNIDTSAMTEGATVWLSGATAGEMTTTKPVAPIHSVKIGICIRSHATEGVVFVNIQNGFELDELHDVLITSPSSGHVLQRNGSNLWVNRSLADAGISAVGHTHAISDVASLQSNLDSKAPAVYGFNSQTASYSIVLTDKDKLVEVNSASATTVTVPTDAAANFPIGSTVLVVQVGAGQVTISPDSGVTVNYTPGNKTRAQWSTASLIKRASNTWLLSGDLTL